MGLQSSCCVDVDESSTISTTYCNDYECEYIENDTQHEKLIRRLSDALNSIENRIIHDESIEFNHILQEKVMVPLDDKYYKYSAIILEKLMKYRSTPKAIFTNYDKLKRSALSVIDFENGAGEWVSTFNQEVYEDLILKLKEIYGPTSFHLIENKLRFPLTEYLINIPREFTSFIPRNDVNDFTDVLFGYYQRCKVELIPSYNAIHIKQETKGHLIDGKRILHHATEAIKQLIDRDPKWHAYTLNIEYNEGHISDAEQTTTDITFEMTKAIWEKIEPFKKCDDIYEENMKKCVILIRIGKTKLVLLSDNLSKSQILDCISINHNSKTVKFTINTFH